MEKKGEIQIPNTPFAFIRFGIKPYKKWFFWTVAFVFLSELLGGLQAYVFKGFVDAATSGISSHIVFLWVLAYSVLILFDSMVIRGSGFMMNFKKISLAKRRSPSFTKISISVIIRKGAAAYISARKDMPLMGKRGMPFC